MKKGNVKNKKGDSALLAASLGRSATAQVRRHSAGDAGLATTGTNVSYEGATAPGGGGSVGTGYASGQEATGAAISLDSASEQNLGSRLHKTKAALKDKEKQDK